MLVICCVVIWYVVRDLIFEYGIICYFYWYVGCFFFVFFVKDFYCSVVSGDLMVNVFMVGIY